MTLKRRIERLEAKQTQQAPIANKLCWFEDEWAALTEEERSKVKGFVIILPREADVP